MAVLSMAALSNWWIGRHDAALLEVAAVVVAMEELLCDRLWPRF